MLFFRFTIKAVRASRVLPLTFFHTHNFHCCNSTVSSNSVFSFFSTGLESKVANPCGDNQRKLPSSAVDDSSSNKTVNSSRRDGFIVLEEFLPSLREISLALGYVFKM